MDKSRTAVGHPPDALEWLGSYRPLRIDADRWHEVRGFVRECVRRLAYDTESSSAWRVVRVLARIAAWAVEEGLSLDPEVVLDPDSVERFTSIGLAGDSSRATYRAVLRRVGPKLTHKAPWQPRPITAARRQVALPYSVAEIDQLKADALAQPTAGRMRAARALLALGAGAGLDGRWVTRVAACDVRQVDQGVVVAIASNVAEESIDDVVWDPGYSLCRPGTVHHKLAQAGIHQTFQPVTHQRGMRPFSGDALLIDGQLFSELLPKELRDLPSPPRGASEAEKLQYESKFNLRARWRMMCHSPPDKDGATRWRCPFCSGFLRSRNFPKTMRGSKDIPLVPVAEGCDNCCNGILTAQAVEMAWWQRITYGTTAWRISFHACRVQP